MEFIGLFQALITITITITIMTLLYMCGRFTFCCWVSPVLAFRKLKRNGLDDTPSPSFQVMDMASSSSSIPASSSSAADTISPLKEKYDVFLSFRGGDTRNTFTSHLREALKGDKIETYIDDILERGDEIAPALLKAIEKSKIAVVIFSKNYASSTWCLDELAHILVCKESFRQIVIPIFYGIEPSHIRKQQGSYADAFAHLEERFKDSMDKVIKWRDALEEAAGISGFDNKTGTEADLVKRVVQDILTKLNCESSSDDLKGLVGIESRIEEIESLLCVNDSRGVCTVGIWGMGGIGKTTMAEAVFKRSYSKFEASCFLRNVREESDKHGLHHLLNALLREIFPQQDLCIGTSAIIYPHVRKRLSRLKVLIVLDDVNDLEQIEVLAGDHFGPGSRIIITTRDRGLLKRMVDCKIFGLEKLNNQEALHLFHLHAFKNSSPRTDVSELSRMVVDYAAGIPLALRILGSLFSGFDSKEDWEEQWSKLKKFPDEKIQNVLRLSYDGLEDYEREIFLDIACFLKGVEIDEAERFIDYRERCIDYRRFFKSGIRTLIDRCLISISESNLKMHDIVQEMGQAICRDQSVEPGKRKRLFDAEDVRDVLENSTGTGTVEVIFLDMSKIRKLCLSPEALEKMYNLKVLKIYDSSYEGNGCKFVLPDQGVLRYLCNLILPQGAPCLPKALRYLCWESCPFPSLPSKIFTENLVELHFPHSQVKQLSWGEGQNLSNLKVLNLQGCWHLTEVPNLSQSRKIERIDLSSCGSLVQIPSYFQSLDKLTHLNLGYCRNLKYLPEIPDNIESLDLSKTAIEELPLSLRSHKKISNLEVTSCEHFKNFPNCSGMLKLTDLKLSGWSSLFSISELPRGLTELELSSALIVELPSSIECVIGLTVLELYGCTRLMSLPTNIYKLKSLQTLFVCDCPRFKCFPEILEPMEHLSFLILEKTAVKDLPSSIRNLIGLEELHIKGCGDLESIPASIKEVSKLVALDLTNCTSLQALPELPLGLSSLKVHGCTSLKTVSSSRTALIQGLDEYECGPWVDEELVFSNCPNLDKNASDNIMADVQLRIMRVATAFSNFVEGGGEDDLDRTVSVEMLCPGNDIPNWFSHKDEGSSITIELPPNWFRTDFLGFALSLVVAFDNCHHDVKFEYKSSFKTSNVESHEFTENPLIGYREKFFWYRSNGGVDETLNSDHVIVWYEYNTREKCSADFYNAFTQISLVWYLFSFGEVKLKKCGIHLLYAQDFEELKCKHIRDAGDSQCGAERKRHHKNFDEKKEKEKAKIGDEMRET